uniref:Uncharacterized protein n=1 Tax=Anopheles atroparvus TaxID=41427 RepID=A0AAG5DHS5_ANOAO
MKHVEHAYHSSSLSRKYLSERTPSSAVFCLIGWFKAHGSGQVLSVDKENFSDSFRIVINS